MCIDNCCFGVLSSWNMHKLLFQVRKINKTINGFRNRTSKINAVENTRDASFCADRLFFICLGWFLLLIHAMSVISFVPLTNTKDDEEHQVDDEFSQCGLHVEFSVPLCLLSLPGRPQS